MDSNSARLEVGALSETGYVRDENQDRMSWSPVPLGELYIVADGMGGHKGGAVAAEIAVQELQRYISEAPGNASVDQVIQAAFKKANETVYAKAHSGDPATEGMGTTAVLLLVSGQVARLAHVGDSRAYLYRSGTLSQLTTDHTVVQKMVQAGMLKPEEAADHPDASVLERAIGSKPNVEVDISKELPLTDGDAILLCSDGLSGYVTSQEIESALRSPSTSQEMTTRLVNLALQKGGNDNVTVQFIQYGPRKAPQLVESPAPEKPATAIAGATGHLGHPDPRSEARPVESTKIDRPPTITVSKPRHYSFHTAAALVLGAAISAAGFYVLRNKEMAGLEGINKQLEETKNARALAEQEVKELKESTNKSVEETRTARVRAEKRVKELETDVSKIRDDLKKTEIAKTKTEKRVKELVTDVNKTRDDLKKTETAQKNAEKKAKDLETEVSRLQNEFKKSEAAKKTAEANVEGLKRQLNEKDIQLKQLQSLTIKTPKEPEKATGSEGTTAPGKTTGPGATTGQKETETK